jgi:hypothetical protein
MYAPDNGDFPEESNEQQEKVARYVDTADDEQPTSNSPTKIDAQRSNVTSPGGISWQYSNQSVSTVDYDYSKVYGPAGENSVVSSVGGTLGADTRHTQEGFLGLKGGALGASQQDEPVIKEHVFEVIVPSGKLGGAFHICESNVSFTEYNLHLPTLICL